MENHVRFASVHMTVDAEHEIDYGWDAARIMQEFGLANQTQEILWVMTYDSAMQVRTIVEIARGGYHEVVVPYPATLAAVLLSGADRFILIHNHPTADVTPTFLDEELTTNMRNAANMVGLYFEDHVIVSPTPTSFSFKEAGLLPPLEAITQMAKENRPRRKRRSAA